MFLRHGIRTLTVVEAPECEPPDMRAQVEDYASRCWKVEAFGRLAVLGIAVDAVDRLLVTRLGPVAYSSRSALKVTAYPNFKWQC
eukprot:SAG11_NODE_1904_length_4088_cov_3.427676_6_plen_85_part_00